MAAGPVGPREREKKTEDELVLTCELQTPNAQVCTQDVQTCSGEHNTSTTAAYGRDLAPLATAAMRLPSGAGSVAQ